MTTPVSATDALADLRLKSQVKQQQLGQEDFLKLMVTQLKNQDPFKPMENGEFLGQIAQFSTVSGIQKLQDTFTSLAASLQSGQALQAANLVGHGALVHSDHLTLPQEGAVAGAVELPASATDVVLEIKDASGAIVQQVSLGTLPAGTQFFSWDGTLADGTRLPAGTYDISARGRIGSRTESLATAVAARIDSVTLGGNDGLILNLDSFGPTPFSAVSQFL